MGRSAIVLAAGHGTRMKSATHKVLHPVCGKPMILHILDALEEAQFDQVIVVVGQQREQVIDMVGTRADIAVQENQDGTGDAVKAALPHLRATTDSVVVLYGDAPLIRAQTLNNLVAVREREQVAATLLSAKVSDPIGLGRVFFDDAGTVSRIVEEKDATVEERLNDVINTGIYAYDVHALSTSVGAIKPDNAQSEYYLTDTIALLRTSGERVLAVLAEDPNEVASVNDRIQLSMVERLCRRRILERWMRAGVTVIDPDTTYVDTTVTLSTDVTLLPGAMLTGTTMVESFATIGPNSRLENTIVRAHATIQNTVAVDSEVGEAAQVGPFAYLRPGSLIGARAKVGDFVEVKNSSIGDDTKISHLAYVGDADIGKHVNIGCGVITVNYDGERKHRTVVGDNSFVGSNVNLIAPLTIGNGAYLCAGSTVTDDVGDDGFAISRVVQTTKAQYVRNWKKRKQIQTTEVEGGDKRGH